MFRSQINRAKAMLKRRLCEGGIDPYDRAFDSFDLTPAALSAATAIRGADRQPAILLLGVMPRSGTVYSGELIRLHPDVHAYPYDLWETPFLELAGDLVRTQERFLRLYQQNRDKMGAQDFLPLFGSAFVAYLHEGIPTTKRLLVKNPDVSHLKYFRAIFPDEDLILLLRDGRDLVHSTLKTWPGRSFSDTCTEWRKATELMLDYWEVEKAQGRCLLVKYEDVVAHPDDFVRQVCERFGLAEDSFPFEAIESLPMRGSSSGSTSGKVTWDPVSSPARASTTRHWTAWSGRRKRIFKQIAGEALLRSGYADSLDW